MPTNIQWADETENTVVGCKQVSPACDNCYACTMHNRNLHNPKQKDYTHHFNVVKELPERLPKLEVKLKKWKKSKKIFINSMSDTFNEDVSYPFISENFDLFCKYPKHVYQILTKRSRRMKKMATLLKWIPNIWAGVTVENKDYYWRIDDLRNTKGPTVRWLSLEPLLGPMDNINLDDIDLIIIGGESAQPGLDRPVKRDPIKMEYEWVDTLIEKAREKNVSIFYKQSGVLQPCIGDHEGDKCKGNKGCEYFRGKKYNEFPKTFTEIENIIK